MSGTVTRIILHIGPDPSFSWSFEQAVLDARDRGTDLRWLYPSGLGQHGHTALFLAALDPDHVDPLRAARGLASEDRHAVFARQLQAHLDTIAQTNPETLILSCDLLGRDLVRDSELIRLRGLLQTVSDRIEVWATIPPLAEGLAAHWASQIIWGRVTPIEADLTGNISRDVTTTRPERNHFPELETPPQWRDAELFRSRWAAVFDEFHQARTLNPLIAALGGLDVPPVPPAPAPPSAQTLARALALNPLIQSALDQGLILPRRTRAKVMAQIEAKGPALAPLDIEAALENPSIAQALLPALVDFDPHALMANLRPKMLRLTRAADISDQRAAPEPVEPSVDLPASVREGFARLVHSRYAPHNRTAPKGEALPPFSPRPTQAPPQPERVIVACMKDEGPYLLEWLAYHREIGFDHVLVYTNDCSDGTDRLLDRLATLGWVTHIDNSDWHGKSPQQAALNHAITLPLIQKAEWVAHIDVDEFVNIRCGNGRLDDLFAACPEATHFALTWRLFGANSVDQIADQPVIEQFTRCAPSFCPKPHTVWGFKTLGRQMGAYGKLSCHRPTKPVDALIDRVCWVNGSGEPMGPDVAQRGWRSNMKTVGYDLVQLNHYALRSRDSFLVKRKRGRALHVDRQIGYNYWVRMDWNDHEDHAILRNLPRLNKALADMKSDPEIAQLHKDAVFWHKTRATALRQDPDMAELIQSIRALSLSQCERAAYAMTLDMET